MAAPPWPAAWRRPRGRQPKWRRLRGQQPKWQRPRGQQKKWLRSLCPALTQVTQPVARESAVQRHTVHCTCTAGAVHSSAVEKLWRFRHNDKHFGQHCMNATADTGGRELFGCCASLSCSGCCERRLIASRSQLLVVFAQVVAVELVGGDCQDGQHGHTVTGVVGRTVLMCSYRPAPKYLLHMLRRCSAVGCRHSFASAQRAARHIAAATQAL